MRYEISNLRSISIQNNNRQTILDHLENSIKSQDGHKSDIITPAMTVAFLGAMIANAQSLKGYLRVRGTWHEDRIFLEDKNLMEMVLQKGRNQETARVLRSFCEKVNLTEKQMPELFRYLKNRESSGQRIQSQEFVRLLKNALETVEDIPEYCMGLIQKDCSMITVEFQKLRDILKTDSSDPNKRNIIDLQLLILYRHMHNLSQRLCAEKKRNEDQVTRDHSCVFSDFHTQATAWTRNIYQLIVGDNHYEQECIMAIKQETETIQADFQSCRDKLSPNEEKGNPLQDFDALYLMRGIDTLKECREEECKKTIETIKSEYAQNRLISNRMRSRMHAYELAHLYAIQLQLRELLEIDFGVSDVDIGVDLQKVDDCFLKSRPHILKKYLKPSCLLMANQETFLEYTPVDSFAGHLFASFFFTEDKKQEMQHTLPDRDKAYNKIEIDLQKCRNYAVARYKEITDKFSKQMFQFNENSRDHDDPNELQKIKDAWAIFVKEADSLSEEITQKIENISAEYRRVSPSKDDFPALSEFLESC